MRPLLLQPFDDLEQMAHRACQPVEAYDQEHIAGPDFFEQLSENRTGPGRPGTLLPMDYHAASRLELDELGVRHLILGRHAGIADQAPFWGRGGGHETR